MSSQPNDGPSLESLLGFVAITNEQRGDEILKQLCVRCLVAFPAENFSSPQSFASVISTVFGLSLSTDRIQKALDRLVAEDQIGRPPGGNSYFVAAAAKRRTELRINAARNLQEDVKERWLIQSREQISGEIDGELAWRCLQQHLSNLFRGHGLQTVQLLDSRATTNASQQQMMKASLEDVISELQCEPRHRKTIEGAIHLFLSTVGSDPARTKYIVQLADGAFSYYSLSAPPELAARLQSQLKEVTLFLDTNFLFGLLGLHVNPFDDVSQELIAVITTNRLPFKLRYHAVTLTEMHRTITGITSGLRGRHWPQALSRAAAKAPYVSSIERIFHEKNAVQSIDPEIFFQPFDHPDELLKAKDILIYRPSGDRMEQRAELVCQYTEFLATRHREKPYEAIDHDMTVLDCVRHQRSGAVSTLDAKALIITCDTVLSRFDWQELRGENELACTTLPNQFLQLLRPFVSSSPEFDKSFAESFAIAEFRTLGSSRDASSRLLSLLSSYKDIREETASALLANELLLDKLKRSKDDRQFKEFVDAALLAENAQLLEEMEAFKRQKEQELKSAEAFARQESQKRKELQGERDELVVSRNELDERVRVLSTELVTTQNQGNSVVSQLRTELTAAKAAASQKERSLQRVGTIVRVVGALSCSALVLWLAEILIKRSHWTWFLTHPNIYAIRGVAYLAVTVFFLGLLKRDWRKECWWGSLGFVALLVLIMSLLGGPAK